ncbi:MAG: carboxylesterase family protein [Beijerinckiaceae bacterium]|nr:carboxylesterase family protein [Beijerinckiaceae bacterium]
MTNQTLTVETKCGVIQGAMASPRTRSFRGVPFAQPPVGPLRWKPPQPLHKWSGVRPALAFGPDCPQNIDVGTRATSMSEDCLYLNIWTPADASASNLPVLVWVYGGSFISGSGSETRLDGARLSEKGAVVVTINYRVGLFGYLAHEQLSAESAHGVSGNYGVLDQMEAFRWIRDNIAAFGGNPDNVTAFGVSAGSASIALLLVSPQAKGLFDRAILESPGAGRPLASLKDAEEAGGLLGDDIGALRAKSQDEILAMNNLLTPKQRGLTIPRVLRPIKDGQLITDDERTIYERGEMNQMPVIVGTNADEGSEFVLTWNITDPVEYDALLKTTFGERAAEAASLYPGRDAAEIKMRLGELFADTQFNYGARMIAEHMAAAPNKAWRYVFTRKRPQAPNGPHHGQEVHYVFGNLGAPYPGELPTFEPVDEMISDAMMDYWIAFARAGDPNVAHLPAWKAYDKSSDNHLEFHDTIFASQRWRKPQVDFLTRYFAQVTK